jgi:hypothetical protein
MYPSKRRKTPTPLIYSLPPELLERVAWYTDVERGEMATICRLFYTAVRHSYKSVTYKVSRDWHELSFRGVSTQATLTLGKAPVFPYVRHVHIICTDEKMYGPCDLWTRVPVWMKPQLIKAVFPRVETVGFTLSSGTVTRLDETIIESIASGAYNINNDAWIPVGALACSVGAFRLLSRKLKSSVQAGRLPDFRALDHVECTVTGRVPGDYQTVFDTFPTVSELQRYAFAPRVVVINTGDNASHALSRDTLPNLISPLLRSTELVRGSKAAVHVKMLCQTPGVYILENLPYHLMDQITIDAKKPKWVSYIQNNEFFRACNVKGSTIPCADGWYISKPGSSLLEGLDDARVLQYYTLGAIESRSILRRARKLFMDRVLEDAVALAATSYTRSTSGDTLGYIVHAIRDDTTDHAVGAALARYIGASLRLIPARTKERWRLTPGGYREMRCIVPLHEMKLFAALYSKHSRWPPSTLVQIVGQRLAEELLPETKDALLADLNPTVDARLFEALYGAECHPNADFVVECLSASRPCE